MNVPINSDKIELGADSKVVILRVRPGEVALVRDLELLLDKGLHVFNSGSVSFEGTKVYATTSTSTMDVTFTYAFREANLPMSGPKSRIATATSR
jgi:hypothetical protein